MRFRSVLVLAGLGLALAGCSSIRNPFTPYDTWKAAQLKTQSGEPTGVLTFDTNVRMKTEAESLPVAEAEMQPRRVIEP